MTTEIIINVASHESRIAIIEDGRVMEILVERPESERMVGDIYRGVVTGILPGIQAAFVEIGLEKNAFLHVSDIARNGLEELFDIDEDDEEGSGRPPKSFSRVPIQDMLRKGQEVMVQITKEPIGQKGPRVTSEVSLPGRFVVLVPNQENIGISRKISDWPEKRRLKNIAKAIKPEGYGLIIRTVGKGKGEDEFKADINMLVKSWQKIKKKAQSKPAPVLVHQEMGMTSSLIRDLFTDDVDKLIIDSKQEYRNILSYLRSVSPGLRSRVELYQDRIPIFDQFNIEKEIEQALSRRVWLKKGGSIVIDHTEALVTIDVNSGKYVGRPGSKDQEAHISKVNLEAVHELARQLRLRDIGGIIVIDFIDMVSASNRKRVLDELKGALKKDRSKTNVLDMSDFGLVEMTRQRVRPSLLHTFSEPCPICNGIGRIEGRDTTVTRIERWLKRCKAGSKERKIILYVHPSVAEYLLENREMRLKLVKKAVGMRVEVISDADLPTDGVRYFSAQRNVDITDEFKA